MKLIKILKNPNVIVNVWYSRDLDLGKDFLDMILKS